MVYYVISESTIKKGSELILLYFNSRLIPLRYLQDPDGKMFQPTLVWFGHQTYNAL